MKKISIIQPSRNTLKYLIWSYNSIRKNLDPSHEICVADDFSNDGTWEWCQQKMKEDKNFKAIRNNGPTRVGHTILYDRLVNEVATNDIIMIFHSDMYACPNMDEIMLSYLKPKIVVSATRIEPPLHPEGPEKIIKDFGIETEEFNEEGLLEFVENYKPKIKYTDGIFAPWIIYKKDFQYIGGHDPLFRPQSKEDSDIFNRFDLYGCTFIQPRDAFVYHMTCRGSRFKDGAKRNPDGQVFMEGRESDEWLIQNKKSTRNFIRKWGSMVKHTETLRPIVPHKYNIGIEIRGLTNVYNLLSAIEPWCDNISIEEKVIKDIYLKNEQPNTDYNLDERVLVRGKLSNDIIVSFDSIDFKNNSQFTFVSNLSEILTDSGEVGKMKYDIFEIIINKLNWYEKNLTVLFN